MGACETDGDVCPVAGDQSHCPCVSGGSMEKCSTLECEDPGKNPGGVCGEFVFSTVTFPLRGLNLVQDKV